MGDYSKTAINTSINSGTVIGVCSNVFGAGLTPKLIPSFSWGYSTQTIYEVEQALEHIERWMQTKKQQISNEEKQLITHIYNQTKQKIMRQQIAAANWKMNLTYVEGQQLLNDILAENVEPKDNHAVIFGIPFPYLMMANEK